MPNLLERLFPQSRGLVFFILVFTISAMGLAPAGTNSIKIAFASLVIQIPLYKYVTEYVSQDALHISCLDYLYVTNALCQIFIVRILAPFLLGWVFRTLFSLFPNFTSFLMRAVVVSVGSAFGFTETMARNWMRIVLKTAQTYATFMNPGSATAIMMPVRQRGSTSLGMAMSNTPLFFIIPSEISKYYILTRAVQSYHLGKEGSRCRNVVIMAVMVAMPVANVEVVTSPHLAGGVYIQDEWHKLTLSVRFLAIMGTYVSCMLSCVMLAVRITQNAILKRKYRTWTIRLLSFAFMWLVQVLTWVSTLDGVLDVVHEAIFSCTLLLILTSTGLFVWSGVARLIADEQLTLERNQKGEKNQSHGRPGDEIAR